MPMWHRHSRSRERKAKQGKGSWSPAVDSHYLEYFPLVFVKCGLDPHNNVVVTVEENPRIQHPELLTTGNKTTVATVSIIAYRMAFMGLLSVQNKQDILIIETMHWEIAFLFWHWTFLCACLRPVKFCGLVPAHTDSDIFLNVPSVKQLRGVVWCKPSNK